jgi:DNA-binding transcriptional MerR regulator
MSTQPESITAPAPPRDHERGSDPAIARFYLREGIVLPTARTESGYLLFDDTELERLRRVIAWRQEGVGLREIRERLNRLRATTA